MAIVSPQATGSLLVESDGPVRILTMNRPDRLTAADAQEDHFARPERAAMLDRMARR